MTSSSSKDQSLTSIALVSSRDGTVNLYRMNGWNEQAVMDAVNVTVSNFKNYHSCAPIPYDCSGRLAYVVSIAASSENGEIFQEIGIVDAITGHVLFIQKRVKKVYRLFKNSYTTLNLITFFKRFSRPFLCR